MFKIYLIFLILVFFLFSCSKKNNTQIISTQSDEEIMIALYTEGVESLKKGDAFYASKKFEEVESILPYSEWAAKASLMNAYSHYSRNSFSDSIFGLERFISNYPADKNIPYAHYLIAICYFEQILDERKDLQPLIQAKEKFEFILLNFTETDYATDARFKLGLIVDQLAAKEMSIARFYMKTQKWIPALNRLKKVVNEYDTTIFIEEALHRIAEVYYKLGLIEEAKQAASILGYNYGSGIWYEKTYKVFNKKYKPLKIDKEKEIGFIRKKIKSLFE